MKRLMMLSFTALTLTGFVACNTGSEGDTSATDSTSVTSSEMDAGMSSGGTAGFVDLSTGGSVRMDEATGRYVDESNNPVDFYVDMNTRDTFSGRSGEVVNNALIHGDDGSWSVDETKIKMEDDELKIKNGDNKMKVEDDEYKSNTGDTKVKVEDDEAKVKNR